MIENVAFSVNSARSWARVYTFISNAGLITRAVRVSKTFGSTFSIGVTLILGYASADTSVTLGVWSTRVWITRVSFWWRCNRHCDKIIVVNVMKSYVAVELVSDNTK